MTLDLTKAELEYVRKAVNFYVSMRAHVREITVVGGVRQTIPAMTPAERETDRTSMIKLTRALEEAG